MEWGRVAGTELMPKLVVGYTELGCSKLKNGKGKSKPNFELGPNLDLDWCQVRRVELLFPGGGWSRLYIKP